MNMAINQTIGNLKKNGIIRISGSVELCEGEHDMEEIYLLQEIINETPVGKHESI